MNFGNLTNKLREFKLHVLFILLTLIVAIWRSMNNILYEPIINFIYILINFVPATILILLLIKRKIYVQDNTGVQRPNSRIYLLFLTVTLIFSVPLIGANDFWNTFHQILQAKENINRYEIALRWYGYPNELAHFPANIPKNAKNVSFYLLDNYISETNLHAFLSMNLPESEINAIYDKYKNVISGGEINGWQGDGDEETIVLGKSDDGTFLKVPGYRFGITINKEKKWVKYWEDRVLY